MTLIFTSITFVEHRAKHNRGGRAVVNKRLIVIMFFIVMFLTGCSRATVAPLPPDNYKQDFSPSQNIRSQIFFDATTSMVGFVAPGEGSEYSQTMQLLESNLIKGWPQQQVEYYKFGTKIVPISRQDSLKARTTGFYNDSSVSLQTHIDQVIDTVPSENLVIIITDLFQSDADVNLLTTKLKDKYLSKGKAVGIVGLRSNFDGKIYDIGVSAYSVPYNSGNKIERYRPYYLLILGPVPDVEHYIHILSNQKIMQAQEPNYLILANRKVVVPAYFDSDKAILALQRMVEVSNLIESGQTNKRVKQFLIRKNDKNVGCTFALKIQSIKYTPKVDPTGIVSNIEVMRLNDQGKFEPDSIAQNSMNIEKVSFSDDAIKVKCSIKNSGLKKAVYSYRVSLMPGENVYTLPGWVDKWNMDLVLISKYQNEPEAFPGNLTLNLEPFVSGLIDASNQYGGNHPVIADVYLYIQNN